MEIALEQAIPTYSGGLGVLAGDLLRSAADLRVSMVGVTLLYRAGYFSQELDSEGAQHERPARWDPETRLREQSIRVDVQIAGRPVAVRAWRYDIKGRSGHVVPVFLLDTELPENDARDRALTGALYGGDAQYRLAQEIVLGIGGARLLAKLFPGQIRKLHLNEGHSALAAWATQRSSSDASLAGIRSRCVFTTHTPVEAGHDHFPRELVQRMLPPEGRDELISLCGGNELDMTQLALRLSGYVNAVSARHQQSARQLFPGHEIHYITNGVHPTTWTSPSMTALLDRRIPGWADEPARLRSALSIPDSEIGDVHSGAKAALLAHVGQKTGLALDPARFTIVFARRASAYKHMDLIFSDIARLRRIGDGRMQLVFSGKAHPNDQEGKQIIRHVFDAARGLGGSVPVVYLPDYELDAARLLVAGADLWLNTPQPPFEASGTSGMKAAFNGVPSLGTLDGWWCEGHVEGVTGWAIEDASDLYEKLELALTAFGDRAAWASIMKHCLAINASYFNTHRALQQYLATAYASE
jgi:starch phosphorylase